MYLPDLKSVQSERSEKFVYKRDKFNYTRLPV